MSNHILAEKNPQELLDSISKSLQSPDFTEFYEHADKLRKSFFGDIIHIRAILEFSNMCRCDCIYCGLNAKNRNITRYRMTPEEIIETSNNAYNAGYKTIVLQSGEDAYYSKNIIGDILREIRRTGITITLSIGERSYDEYAYFKSCGAGRYLLKHETSDENIYKNLHPSGSYQNRVECLKNLKKLGYETGSGFMIGLPGQTERTIARDLMLLKEIGCDMAGIGPFIPHPDTDLKDIPPGNAELTMRAVALARIMQPGIHLPATTALSVLDAKSADNLFSRGANVIMKKITPDKYRKFYEIYPSDTRSSDIQRDRENLEHYIRQLGRIPA